MSDSKIILNQLRGNAGLRLAVLFCAFFFLLIIASILDSIFDGLPFGSVRDKGLTGSVLQSLLAFAIPAYIAARYSSDTPFRWLKMNKGVRLKPFWGVIIVYLISLPGMEWLINWNANIVFPETLTALETTFRAWEENSQAMTGVLLETKSIGGIICGVAIIGVLTGFSEEIFFRGALQGIFQRSTLGFNLSVWLAAFIFSTMHFQFFGFIPRLLMGAFFGYLFLWTKNLWVPVFAHALNNSIVVITASLSDNPADIATESILPTINSLPYLLPLTSGIFTSFFFIYFRGYFFKREE